MSATTPIYAFPYPQLGSDSPNGAQQIQDLAVAVETALQTAVVKDATGTAGNIEIVKKSVNPGSLASQNGQDFTISGLTSLLVGDYCIFIGGGIRSQILRTETLCTTAGQILMHQFNTDSVAVNMGPVDVYLLILHHA